MYIFQDHLHLFDSKSYIKSFPEAHGSELEGHHVMHIWLFSNKNCSSICIHLQIFTAIHQHDVKSLCAKTFHSLWY